jgi:hypothetical protein
MSPQKNRTFASTWDRIYLEIAEIPSQNESFDTVCRREVGS